MRLVTGVGSIFLMKLTLITADIMLNVDEL